jgi:hypothetical protein
MMVTGVKEWKRKDGFEMKEEEKREKKKEDGILRRGNWGDSHSSFAAC